jgi:hypothetical protein
MQKWPTIFIAALSGLCKRASLLSAMCVWRKGRAHMNTTASLPATNQAPARTPGHSLFASIKRAFVTEVLGLAEIPAERHMVKEEDEVRISDSNFNIGPSDRPIISVPTSSVHGVILSPVSGEADMVDAIVRTKRRPGSLHESYGGTFSAASPALSELKRALHSRNLG